MTKVKVLHLAAFSGNIGDNANIIGTRRTLVEDIGPMDFTDLDIMPYVFRQREFDAEFVALANRFDLLLVGGGGFFEPVCDDSPTGGPLRWTDAVVDGIKTPMLFHALGANMWGATNQQNVAKLTRFLSRLCDSPRAFVSIRNDGTWDMLRREGFSHSRLDTCPDGGFFVERRMVQRPGLSSGRWLVGVNLAGDMLSKRFPAKRLWGRKGDGDSSEEFVRAFGRLCRDYLDQRPDVHLRFFPHTYHDVLLQGRVINEIGSRRARYQVTMAPYVTGMAEAASVLASWEECHAAIGMRFHANVTPIGLCVLTVGLDTYPQIPGLYAELLGLPVTAPLHMVSIADSLDTLPSQLDAALTPGRDLFLLNRMLREHCRQSHQRAAAWLAQCGAERESLAYA